MSRRRVTQVLVGAGSGDAITSMAFRLRDALEPRYDAAVHAHFIPAEMAHSVRPLHELPPGRRDDVLVYHASYGAPQVTRALLERPERLVLVYHNITPSEHFLVHQPEFAAGLEWGRHELALLRDRVSLTTADSSFNAGELAALGYPDVHVLPVGLTPSRLRTVPPDGDLASHLRERFPHGYVLSVSQVLPHKRFETLVQAMHLVRWVHEIPLGLVVVGALRLPDYHAALLQLCRQLRVDDTWFTGGVDESWLATFFRMSRMHVTTSVHEGLALPPLEAMSFGVPVLARAAGALPETVGRAGALLPEDAGAVLFSEAIAELHLDEERRRRQVLHGIERIAEIERADAVSSFVSLLEDTFGRRPAQVGT